MKLVLVLGLLAACDAAEKPTEYMDGAATERYLTMFDKAHDIIAINKADCGKMASELDALFAASKPVIDAANAAAKAGKELPKLAVAHVSDHAKDLAASIEPCAADKAVRKAFKKLEPKDE